MSNEHLTNKRCHYYAMEIIKASRHTQMILKSNKKLVFKKNTFVILLIYSILYPWYEHTNIELIFCQILFCKRHGNIIISRYI